MWRRVGSVCWVVAWAACSGASLEDEYGADASPESVAVARILRATSSFRSLDAAIAAGYAATVSNCIAHAQHGAMGFHHVNRNLLDDRLELERPEILVYERLPDSSYVLNGVEYIIPYTARSREADPPTLLGQQLKRADGLQLWYLHVWVWKDNATGLFADWNPAVECRP